MGVFKVEAGIPASAVRDQISTQFRTPVIVEEFAPGREVMVRMTKILDAGLREVISRKERGIRPVSDRLNGRLKAACLDVFEALGNIHYLRINGRLSGDDFKFLEFVTTPPIGAP